MPSKSGDAAVGSAPANQVGVQALAGRWRQAFNARVPQRRFNLPAGAVLDAELDAVF
jgi:hypothetical protein